MTKNEIAHVLTEIGTLLELKGENPFKTRAYQAGARVLESIEQQELDTLIREERLKSVKGIGDALAQKITELHTTGGLEFFENLKASIEPGLVEMLEVPGLGPKKIKAIHDQLGLSTLAELSAACLDGRVAALAGFGEKSQEKILAGIRNREAYGKRHLWWDAQAVALPIVAGLRALPQVVRAEAAGSLRRGMETVGDLDFIVAATDVEPVVSWFVTQPGVAEITARGETKASVRFTSGLQADLRLVPAAQFAFALHHFTGSKDHNVAMRQRALARGLSLSEWGLVPAEGEGTVKEKIGLAPIETTSAAQQGSRPLEASQKRAEAAAPLSSAAPAITSETELFAALGLAFIPPELREGLGEIEAAEFTFNARSLSVKRSAFSVERSAVISESASSLDVGSSLLDVGRSASSNSEATAAVAAGGLPRLIEATDLRGAFHNHTTASDGGNTLAEMTAAAEALGWDYLGIADHSKSSVQAKGLTEERLARQVEEIRALNASGRFKTHVFAGSECDILPDGRLDFDDAVLASLDYVVASVHSVFTQSFDDMTARIIRAIENPRTTMLGHATGRLLLRREGYAIDFGKIIDAAIAHDVIIELNASPWRLDLDWRYWRKAADRGLVCAINPDAHDTEGLTHVRAGVNSARKGWLTAAHVLNTRPLAEVQARFARR